VDCIADDPLGSWKRRSQRCFPPVCQPVPPAGQRWQIERRPFATDTCDFAQLLSRARKRACEWFAEFARRL